MIHNKFFLLLMTYSHLFFCRNFDGLCNLFSLFWFFNCYLFVFLLLRRLNALIVLMLFLMFGFLLLPFLCSIYKIFSFYLGFNNDEAPIFNKSDIILGFNPKLFCKSYVYFLNKFSIS